MPIPIVYLCKYFPRSRAFLLIRADYRATHRHRTTVAALLLALVHSLHTQAHSGGKHLQR